MGTHTVCLNCALYALKTSRFRSSPPITTNQRWQYEWRTEWMTFTLIYAWPRVLHFLIFIVFQIIFGTGDTLQAITVSANVGFVRAAENQVKPFFKCQRKNQKGYPHTNSNLQMRCKSFCKHFREYHLSCFCTNRGFWLKRRKKLPNHSWYDTEIFKH